MSIGATGGTSGQQPLQGPSPAQKIGSKAQQAQEQQLENIQEFMNILLSIQQQQVGGGQKSSKGTQEEEAPQSENLQQLLDILQEGSATAQKQGWSVVMNVMHTMDPSAKAPSADLQASSPNLLPVTTNIVLFSSSLDGLINIQPPPIQNLLLPINEKALHIANQMNGGALSALQAAQQINGLIEQANSIIMGLNHPTINLGPLE